jgi:hypothetical protein
MYPHVVQFESRRHEFERELQLLRERKHARAGWPPSETRTETASPRSPGHPGSRNLELEPTLTTERTLP